MLWFVRTVHFPPKTTKMLDTLAYIPFIATLITAPTALDTTVSETSNFFVKTESEIVLNVHFVHQKEDLVGTEDEWAGGSACGPASLTMVLNDQGKTYDLQTVINAIPTSVYIKGEMFYDLASGPSYFGFNSYEIDINTTQIYETLEKGYPVVLNIQNYDGITGHALVVVGIKGYNGKTAQSLVAHDPFRAPYRVFDYINETTLKQPEGWILPIGIIKPFYITNYSLASSLM